MIPSTGGAAGMTPEERLQPTELFPEMATLDCGTCNFGDDDLRPTTMPTMRAFGKRMLENNIKPEYECFELGHLDTVRGHGQEGRGARRHPMQFNFVLGVSRLHSRHRGATWLSSPSKIPAGSTWTVYRRGPCRLDHGWPRPSPWAATSVWASRITSIWSKGQKAASNGELVAKVVRMAKELGREIATPD